MGATVLQVRFLRLHLPNYNFNTLSKPILQLAAAGALAAAPEIRELALDCC